MAFVADKNFHSFCMYLVKRIRAKFIAISNTILSFGCFNSVHRPCIGSCDDVCYAEFSKYDANAFLANGKRATPRECCHESYCESQGVKCYVSTTSNIKCFSEIMIIMINKTFCMFVWNLFDQAWDLSIVSSDLQWILQWDRNLHKNSIVS